MSSEDGVQRQGGVVKMKEDSEYEANGIARFCFQSSDKSLPKVKAEG